MCLPGWRRPLGLLILDESLGTALLTRCQVAGHGAAKATPHCRRLSAAPQAARPQVAIDLSRASRVAESWCWTCMGRVHRMALVEQVEAPTRLVAVRLPFGAARPLGDGGSRASSAAPEGLELAGRRIQTTLQVLDCSNMHQGVPA